MTELTRIANFTSFYNIPRWEWMKGIRYIRIAPSAVSFPEPRLFFMRVLVSPHLEIVLFIGTINQIDSRTNK